MKWSLQQLSRYTKTPLEFEGKVDYSEYVKYADILRMDEVSYSGTCLALSDEYLIADNYMAFANMGGFPSISIPLGFDNGLPFGANLTGKPFAESEVLSIANNLEKIICVT